MDEIIFPGTERRVNKDEAIRFIAKQDFRRLIFLSGEMNAGKTHTMIEAIEECEGCNSVLFVVGRRSLVSEIENRMSSVFDVYNYADNVRFKEGIMKLQTGRLEVVSIFITCINSLLKLKESGATFDMICIDEATLTMTNLISPGFIPREKGDEILTCLKTVLFRQAKIVVLIDAALPETLKQDAKKMMNSSPDTDEAKSFDLRLIREGTKPIFDKAYFYQPFKYALETLPDDKEGMIMNEILHSVYVLNHKITISCPWAEAAYQLRDFILGARPDCYQTVPHIVVQTAPEKQSREARVNQGFTEETTDLHELFEEADVIIFNSCISAGHSFETVGVAKHFAFYTFGSHSNSLLEYNQMNARFRNIESGSLHIAILKVDKTVKKNESYLDLDNFCTANKKWEKELTSSYAINRQHVKRSLSRAFPGIKFKNGKIRKMKCKKSVASIHAKSHLDKAEVRKVYKLDDFPNKWDLVSGNNNQFGVYTRNIPSDLFQEKGITFRKTFSGEYYLVCS